MTNETSGAVHFGIQLPIQAQSTLFAQPWETTASVDDFAAIAVTADTAGFDYVGVCDHVAIPERLAGAMSTTWYDNVTTLGWLAGITKHTRLLSHVHVLAYRHPAQTAHAFATLDHLSGGRAILGVGAGHVPEEFELLGLDFSSRGQILDERLEQVKRYLNSEFVDGLGATPRPVQQPGLPIWVGGSSDAAIRRAALAGDGWLPQGTPKEQMPAAVERIRELRASAGRTGPFAIGSITDFISVGDPTWNVGEGTLSGPPEEIASPLREYVSMGVTHLQVRFMARSPEEHCEQMQAFASSVAPLLAD